MAMTKRYDHANEERYGGAIEALDGAGKTGGAEALTAARCSKGRIAQVGPEEQPISRLQAIAALLQTRIYGTHDREESNIVESRPIH